jgi:hypothetical protein
MTYGSDVFVSSNYNTVPGFIPLTSTTALLSYASGENYIVTNSGGTLSVSSSFNTSIGSKISFGWRISDNVFVGSYVSSNDAYLFVGTVSGTSLSWSGTGLVITDYYGNSGTALTSCGAPYMTGVIVSSTKFLYCVMGSQSGSWSYSFVQAAVGHVTISGTSLTLNSTDQLNPTGASYYPSYQGSQGFPSSNMTLDTVNKKAWIGSTINTFTPCMAYISYSDSNTTISTSYLQLSTGGGASASSSSLVTAAAASGGLVYSAWASSSGYTALSYNNVSFSGYSPKVYNYSGYTWSFPNNPGGQNAWLVGDYFIVYQFLNGGTVTGYNVFNVNGQPGTQA